MKHAGYKEIKLNDIARYSPWPARLLGQQAWKPVHRDTTKVKEEYDQGSYALCLRFLENAKHRPTYKQVRAIEFGGGNPTVCASWSDDLYSVKLMRAYEDYYDLIAKSVLPYVSDGTTVVELGCGYGFNLAMLKKRTKKKAVFMGGEYSHNAVTLAGRLLEGVPDISVRSFNFYDVTYPILEQAEGPVVIFTAHAIEQIPDISNLCSVLPHYKEKIKAVVHVEPVYEFQGEGLLGLMREQYIEVSDYNRNLFTQIQRCKNVHISKIKKNIFGINGLNPSSVIEWRFTE